MTNRAPIQSDNTLANRVTGERFTFIETAATSNGALLAFELELRAGGGVPMPHVHPIQTERFEVLDGTVRFRVGRRVTLAAAGEVVEIAPGVVHGFSNPGAKPVRMRVDVSPALQMEQMLREVVALAEAGRLTKRGLPRNPLELARLARAYEDVAHAPLVSVRVQRVLLAPLTFVSRFSRGALAAPRQRRSAQPLTNLPLPKEPVRDRATSRRPHAVRPHRPHSERPLPILRSVLRRARPTLLSRVS
jgi:quercetin dioxygenase-like cupin family protein